MAWQQIHGHDQVIEQFRRAIQRGRLASSFLFVGAEGIGKQTFAVKLARALLCESAAEQDLDPCGQCPSCQQVAARTHPDLIIVERPSEKNFIPVETFIGDREHRMREGLCHDIAMKPFCGGRKIAIIDDADFLNLEGANCLLKTLEEPPPGSILILVGTSEHKQLPTIRSRCQIVRFHPLSDDALAEVLVNTGITSDRDSALTLARLAGGSIKQAVRYADSELQEVRQRLLSLLATGGTHRSEFVSYLTAYVDEAGKEASARRLRMTQVVDLAVEFYHQLMRFEFADADTQYDEGMKRALEIATRQNQVNGEFAADRLIRCLETRQHIAANANQATLLECWIDGLCN